MSPPMARRFRVRQSDRCCTSVPFPSICEISQRHPVVSSSCSRYDPRDGSRRCLFHTGTWYVDTAGFEAVGSYPSIDSDRSYRETTGTRELKHLAVANREQSGRCLPLVFDPEPKPVLIGRVVLPRLACPSIMGCIPSAQILGINGVSFR